MHKKKLLNKLGVGLLTFSTVVSATTTESLMAAENDTSFEEQMERAYEEPEMKYRPYARWWLAEGSHTDKTLKESIQELYNAGYGGIEFVTLDETAYLDDETYAWGSEEWIHDSKLIIEECEKLGMSVSMTGGTNWATTNLTNITPDQEEASQELGYVYVDVPAGETFGADPAEFLPKCELPEGVTKQVLKNVVAAKIVEKGSDTETYEKGEFQSTVLDMDSSEDLTDLVTDEDETGNYKLVYKNETDSDYRIFVFYQYGTGESYKPAVTGQSYTINYLSKVGADAFIDYWNEHVLTDDVKEIISNIDECSMYLDSMELRARGKDSTGQLWCEQMLEEFLAKNDYDITKYLPFLVIQNAGSRTSSALATGGTFGNSLEYTYEPDGEDAEAFITKMRYDFCQTLTEMYMENYLDVIREWLHDNNMKLRAETSYGKTFEISQPIKSVDYVETESLEFFNELDLYRGMAGAAHLYNIRYSSETGANRWTNYYFNNGYYRQIFYMQYAAGVQKTVTHGYSSEYGPEGRVNWPGYEGMKNMYSERFNKRQPGFIDYEELDQHLSRIQKVLEQGTAQMDIAMLRTDYTYNNGSYTKLYQDRLDNYDNYVHNNTGFYWKDMSLQNEGYTYDYFSPYLLTDEDLSCENGILNPDGGAYQAIIVMEDELPYASAEKLLAWAKEGMPIVFVNNVQETIGNDWEKYNTIAGSTTGSNDGLDDELSNVVTEIKQQSSVRTVDSPEQANAALKELGVYPRASYTESNKNLLSVLRKGDDADYLYVYNYMYEDEQNYKGQISVDGLYQPYELNTWNGDVTKLGDFTTENGRTVLNVDLAPGDIMIFILKPNTDDVTSVVRTENVYKVIHEGNSNILGIAESNDISAVCSDGTVFSEQVNAPDDIVLDDWNLTVDSYEPGEKLTRTETTEDTGVTSTEITYATNHNIIDAGTLTELVPWKEIEALGDTISGVGTYTTTFTLPSDWTAEKYGADFIVDDIHDGTVALIVNGEKAAINMDSKKADISAYVAAGTNTIEVRVTSSLRNKMIDLEYDGWNYAKTPTWNVIEPDDYGMTGTARIITYTKVAFPETK